jgi:D-alanine-D-alanine ligase-like ATP-grasp enzyme
VLYTLDGVLDAAGRIWWLEVNSNPIFAPTGYPLMLETLFGSERERVPVSSTRRHAELTAEAQA